MQLSSLQCSTKTHIPSVLTDTSFIFADPHLLSGTTGCHFAASRIWPAGEAAPSLDDSLCLAHKRSSLVNKKSSPLDPKRAGSRIGVEHEINEQKIQKERGAPVWADDKSFGGKSLEETQHTRARACTTRGGKMAIENDYEHPSLSTCALNTFPHN